MKFKGKLIQRHTGLIIETKFGNFYLDANCPDMRCIPTQNILAAANYPSNKKFDIELIKNNSGFLKFVHPEMEFQSPDLSGYYFGMRHIATFFTAGPEAHNYENKKKQINRLEHALPKSWKEKAVSYDLIINGIFIYY